MPSLFDPVPDSAAPASAIAATGTPPALPRSDDAWRRFAAGAATIPFAPLAMYGLLSEAQRAVSGQPFAGGDTANQITQGANRWVHEQLDVAEPQTLLEHATEIGGSLAAGPAAAGARAPALVRGAMTTVLGQPQTVRGAAALTAGFTGLNEWLQNRQAAAQQPAATGSLTPQPMPASTVAPVAATAAPATATPTVPPGGAPVGAGLFDVPTTGAPAPPAASPTTAPSAAPSVSLFGDAPATQTTATTDAPGFTSTDAAVAGGVAVGLGILLHRMVRPPAPAAVRTAAIGLNAPTAGVTPAAVRVQGNLLEQFAPAVHALDSLGVPSLTRVGRNVLAGDAHPQAITIRRMHAFTEGVMDDTRLSEPPRQIVKDYTNLSPAQQQAYEHLRLIENEAGTLANGGKASLPNNPVTGQPWGATPADALRGLMRESSALRSDASVAALMNRTQNLQRSIWQHAFDQGLITAAEHQQMTMSRTGYAPLIQQTDAPNILTRLINITGNPEQATELVRLRDLLKQEGAAAGTRFLPSAPAMETMINTLMTTAAHNRARIFVLDPLANAPGGSAYGVRVVPKAGTDTITVLRNGVEQHFSVPDEALRNALRVMPESNDVITGVLNGTRRVFTEAATGLLNPAFAPVSGAWNGVVAALTRPRGTRVGLFPGDVVGGAAENFIGTARGLYGTTVRGMSQMLQDSIRNNGFLAQSMTPAMAQHWANKLAASWHNSTLHAMQELGASSVGRLTADSHIPNRYTMLNLVPEYMGKNKVLSYAYTMYRDVLDLLKSGSSIQFFARNRGRVGDETAARMAMELAGNAGTHGSAWQGRSALGGIPYANVGLQEFAAFGRSMREGGWANGSTRMAGRLALGVALPAMAMVEAGRQLGAGQTEDYFDYIYRRMSPEQQARYLVIPIPGMRPEDMPHIALPNSIRPAWSVARDGYAMLSGVTPEATAERMGENWWRGGVLTAQPFSTPPVLNTLLATFFNSRLDIPGRGNTMGSVTPVHGSGAAVGDPNRTQGLPPDATTTQRLLYSTMLNSIVTSVAATAGQTGLDSLRAMEMALRPNGTGAPVRDVGQAATMPAQRTLSMFGANDMWGQSQRVSLQNQDSQGVRNARNELKRITDEYNANVLNIGRAGGRTGPSDANLAQVTGVPDTNMRTLMDRAAGLSRSMSNGELRRLGELRDQQAGITTSPSFSPRERAEQRNTIDRQIMEQERSTLRRIQQFEQEQSVYWGRRIRLSDITRGTRISDLPLLAPR